MSRQEPSTKFLARAAPIAVAAVVAASLAGSGCMSLTPQLHPTDYEKLEKLESREEREQAYVDNAIYPRQDTRGGRYVKGTDIGATPRSWQSLDAVLRSDANSAAALPHKKLRASRIMFAVAIGTALVAVAGIAASSREGLDLKNLTGTGGILLGGGIATVGLGIGSGIAYGQGRRGYEQAVNVYNDSLGVRLGLYTPEGEYIPPRGVLVDEDGFIVLDQKELQFQELAPTKPKPEPEPEPEPKPADAADAAVAEPTPTGDPGDEQPKLQRPERGDDGASEPPAPESIPEPGSVSTARSTKSADSRQGLTLLPAR